MDSLSSSQNGYHDISEHIVTDVLSIDIYEGVSIANRTETYGFWQVMLVWFLWRMPPRNATLREALTHPARLAVEYNITISVKEHT